MTDETRNYQSPASGYKPAHGGYPQPSEEKKDEPHSA